MEISDELRKQVDPNNECCCKHCLSNKCKEYALSKGYYLRAEQGVNYKDNLQWTAFLNTNMDDGADYVDYWNSTEPEAIFKAAQWVLDNTSTNKLKGH